MYVCDPGPCKYGFNCTRIDCFYQHPNGRKIDSIPSHDDKCPDGAVCKYGSRCTRSDCWFLHPSGPDGKSPQHAPRFGAHKTFVKTAYGSSSVVEPTTSNTVCQNQHSSSISSSVPCRFGLACGRRSTCRFKHPDDSSCDLIVTHSGHGGSPVVPAVTCNDRQSQQDASDVSSADEYDDAEWQEQPEGADAELWQHQQQHSGHAWAAGATDGLQQQADTVHMWLAAPEACMSGQCQQQPPGKAFGEELVTVPQVGPALADHLRSCHGSQLQGLRMLLSASRVLWLPGSSTLWASVPAYAAHKAHQKLLSVVSAARTELSSQRLELPLIGGTRLLLLPGGGISHVLTRDLHITLSISDLPTNISEQQIRDKLSSFGSINRLQLIHDTTSNTNQQQQAGTKAQPASKPTWARVMFEEPDQATLALASAEQLKPWNVKACKPPPIEHTFTQGTLRLRVNWKVGRPTGNTVVQLASATAANCVIKHRDKQGPSRNMLSINNIKVFVVKCRGTDRVLLLKPPLKERKESPGRSVLSEQAVRTCLLQKCKIQPADIVSITPQHELPRELPLPAGGRRRHNATTPSRPGRHLLMEQWQHELEEICGEHGQLRQVSLPGYNPHTGQATAFLSYHNIEACHKAAASLSGRSGPGKDVYGRSKHMTVEVEHCMTLAVDARTLSAVKPQLEAAIAQVRTRIPGVTVALLERPASAPSAAVTEPVDGRAVDKSPSSSRQSCSAVAIPSSVSCEGLVKLTGSSNEAVVAARALLEPAVAGRVFDGAGVGGVATLLTPAGKAFLLGLEAEYSQQAPARHGYTTGSVSAVHIRWERQLNRLRLYGPNSKLDQLEAAIMQHLHSSKHQQGKTIRLPLAAYQQVLKGGREGLEALRQQSGAATIALDVIGKGLVVEGSDASLAAAEAAAVAFSVRSHQDQQAAGKASPEGVTHQGTCPVCMCDLDEPYSLAGCGHSYCTSCLRAMLSSASHNNDFPVKCCAEGCTSCICLSDLTHLLPAVELSAAYKAAFRAFVLANHDSWGCCPTADCPQVYQRGVACFQCDCCLKSLCTLCLEPFHSGQSCQEYKAWKLAASQGDREFEVWKRQNTKTCPGCRTAIEKSYGCNHMTCSKCSTHFCWLCGQKFENANSTYDHLNQMHGGILDV